MELFPFQKTGVDFLLLRERALLADEMGLGKTIQVLEGIARLGEGTINTLIVCPASLCLMWSEAIKKRFDKEVIEVIHLRSQTKTQKFSKKLRFVICSYNYIQKTSNVQRLKKLQWSVIVSDEHHYTKNWLSKTCKGFIELSKNHTGKIWMLTGTPATRNGQDYYPYLEVMESGQWGTFREFSERFCNARQCPWSRRRVYEGVQESKKILLKKAFSRIMLRRKREDVLTELPPVLSNSLPVEVEAAIVAECLQMDTQMIAGIISRGAVIPGHLSSVRKSIGLAKVESAVEFLLNMEIPVVVFAVHVQVIENIRSELEKNGIKHGLITGAETVEEKQRTANGFQNGEINVVLCNIKAGGVGITLHRASHVLFVELDWSPANMQQAVSRVIRIGQKADCVNIHYLIAYKTVDEQVLEAVRYKNQFLKDIMND